MRTCTHTHQNALQRAQHACAPSLHCRDPLNQAAPLCKTCLAHVHLSLPPPATQRPQVELKGESAPEGMPGVNSPSLSGLRSITHRPTGSKGPPSSPVPMDPELFTQTGVGCLQRHSGCILQTRDEHTQTKEYSGNECLTSGLAREAGKLWSIFLGPTTFPYKSSMPMTLGAVRSHLINEHILDGNNIFK